MKKLKLTKKSRRPWLPCPACGEQVSVVVCTRKRVGERVRKCAACGERFTTTEAVNRRPVNISVSDAIPVLESLIEGFKRTPPRGGATV